MSLKARFFVDYTIKASFNLWLPEESNSSEWGLVVGPCKPDKWAFTFHKIQGSFLNSWETASTVCLYRDLIQVKYSVMMTFVFGHICISCKKCLLACLCLSSCISTVCIVWYWGLYEYLSRKSKIWLKSEKNIWHFTWRPTYRFFFVCDKLVIRVLSLSEMILGH